MDGNTGVSEEGGVSAEALIGYTEVLGGSYRAVLSALRECADCGLEPSARALREHARLSPVEIALFFMCAVMWTELRRALTIHVFQVRRSHSQQRPLIVIRIASIIDQ